MSELAGPISIEVWQRFETALQAQADAQDWDKLVKVNRLMINALKKAGNPITPSQLAARKSLANTHAHIVQGLNIAQAKLQLEISQFERQQDGLAAYQLTSLSGEYHDS
ncbi:hypothetical protein HQQ94_01915 [Shewanella sp. VB17]|uniref:hypothetical protein n=1 Tax=Shewanella sp. VB17 TaxID=2739432 RepID=UPI001565ED54|nr:hypothetical protein [Shewanella sp. VB17]NRD72018.1 hypothetical protein [Shewanella sp. VB17]